MEQVIVIEKNMFCYTRLQYKSTHDKHQVKLRESCGKVAGARDLEVSIVPEKFHGLPRVLRSRPISMAIPSFPLSV